MMKGELEKKDKEFSDEMEEKEKMLQEFMK
jgi:hypothetical protein